MPKRYVKRRPASVPAMKRVEPLPAAGGRWWRAAVGEQRKARGEEGRCDMAEGWTMIRWLRRGYDPC